MKLKKIYRRIYAIADIHGRKDKLDLALKYLLNSGFDFTLDLLVFTGDLIDRGPNSYEVLETVKRLVESHPENVFLLRGNHESFPIQVYLYMHNKNIWYRNGGYETEISYPDGYMSMEHVLFLKDRPFHLEVQGFYFSHAPVPRETKRKGRKFCDEFGFKGEEYNIWERSWHYIGPKCEKKGAYMDVHEGPLSDSGTGSEHLVGICGHIHRGEENREVRIFPNYRMLDVGCGCFEASPLAIHECLTCTTHYF